MKKHIVFKTNSESTAVNLAVCAAAKAVEDASGGNVSCSVDSPLAGVIPWMKSGVPDNADIITRLVKMSGYYTGLNIIESVADSVLRWGRTPEGAEYREPEDGFINPAERPECAPEKPYCLIETSSDRQFSARLLSLDNYRDIADFLAGKGLLPVFIGVSGSDFYIERHPDNGLDLTGETTLEELAGLIRYADMTIFQPSVPAVLGMMTAGRGDRIDIVYCTGGDNRHWTACRGRTVVETSCTDGKCGKRMVIPFGEDVTSEYATVCLDTEGEGDGIHPVCTGVLTQKIINEINSRGLKE